MPFLVPRRTALSSAVLALASTGVAWGQAPATSADGQPAQTLAPVTVRANADASKGGLKAPYAGGQVARGGRVGVLGDQDMMDTPFSTTAYTNELIQDRQAKSVGDVLQDDPSVRMARGFGNFQESYFIRGFLLSSDNVAYNGLYSLLPRQYIATELFERVEVLRGASTFLTGATPGGDGIGGTVNLVPKRAPEEPLTRVTTGVGTGGQYVVSTDIARRFGPDNATGVRFNAARRDGGDGVDHEHAGLSLLALGVDWHTRDVRLSGDIGWQNNQLRQTRTNVSLTTPSVPAAPDPRTNWAEPWSYSNERDLFGTLRGEWDITNDITAWAAYGFRRSDEANSLANLTVNSLNGDGSVYRFDNTRKDLVNTGELGVRGKVQTGAISHEWVVSAALFDAQIKAAYGFDYANQLATNLYDPTQSALPNWSSSAFFGGDLNAPNTISRTRLTSYAFGDTLGFMGDQLKLTLGARYQKLDLTNDAYGTAALLPPEYDKGRVSPVVALLYKLNKQVSLYANYIEALTQGDTATGTPPPVNNGQVLSPYVSKQKEAGVKFDLGGRLGGSVAYFTTTQPRSLVDSSNVFTSSGENRHQGVELLAFGVPTAGVRVLGGMTFLDAKQISTGSATTDGKREIGVPNFEANLGAETNVPGVSGLAADARLVYTGAEYADAANTLKVPSWTRLDLGTRYEFNLQGRDVTLRARVKNVTNRAYWSSVGGYPGNGYLVLGDPRSFTLTASVDF